LIVHTVGWFDVLLSDLEFVIWLVVGVWLLVWFFEFVPCALSFEAMLGSVQVFFNYIPILLKNTWTLPNMASKDNAHGTNSKNQTSNQTPTTNHITNSKSDNNTSNQPTVCTIKHNYNFK
jgi:hypothetical protein